MMGFLSNHTSQKVKCQFKCKYGLLYSSVYNTSSLHVDANLDAPDNVISGNEPSSEMLTSQNQIH